MESKSILYFYNYRKWFVSEISKKTKEKENMKTLDFVKEHIGEIEQDHFIDQRFTKRFIDFLPSAEWEKYGYKYNGEDEYIPK